MATSPLKTSKVKETTSQTVSRAKAMLAQTSAQGNTAFAGSGYDKPTPQVLGAATSQPTASGSIKDLSIALANQNAAASTKAPSTGSGSIKDLSIGLAKGNPITQEDIGRAQAGGASLASLAAPAASANRTSTPTSQSNQTSNQTGVGGGKGNKNRYSRYGLGNDEDPIVEEPSYEQIQKEMMKNAQKEINSLYKYQSSLLGEQQQVNQENLQQNAAVNTLTGLAGSSEANVTTQRVQARNQQADQKIRDQVNVQIQGVLSNVRKDAQQMYQFERQQANVDAETQHKNRAEAYEKAGTNATMLAASGATAEGYKATDPEGYQYLADTLGGEEVLKSMFTLNRPQEQILDKKIEGGKYIISYQNPLDGKVRIETVDLGLPPQYTKTIDAGDRILAIPDNWSGDPSELITVNKGLTPTQQQGAGGSEGGGIYDVLDFRTANAVISQSDKFTSSDIVKRFNNVQDARNNISQIDAATQNPADHQAIVYYFAKALDPESVVREGEYETIKKYSQNIFGKYKGELNNAINGTGFLSAGAIQNIKDTIENRYTSGLTQYTNKQKETARVIDTIAGKPVAGMVLTDYEGGGVDTQSEPVDGLSEEDAYQAYLAATNGSK